MDIDVINRALPVVPHELTGADCCGCIVVREAAEGNLQFVCNEVLRGSWGRSTANCWSRCCNWKRRARVSTSAAASKAVFTASSEMLFYICQHCGQTIRTKPEQVQ